MNNKPIGRYRFNPCIRALSAIVFLCALAAAVPSARGQEQYSFDTASAWNTEDGIIGGLGPGQSSTMGETIIAPDAAEVTLNDFKFYGQSYYPEGGYANLDLEAFVYAWSGNVTGTGGGAVGAPLYLGPAFTYSPPPPPGNHWDGPWTPLMVTLGQGVSLNPGQAYVIGVTLSDPACYAASSGDVEFQELGTYQIPAGTLTGDGEAVWDNNDNDFAEINSGAWSTWGNTGTLAFTADFTVVPEPPIAALAFVGVLVWVAKSFASRSSATQFGAKKEPDRWKRYANGVSSPRIPNPSSG
ncbi:MAG TPA: hypothetical protein VME24_12560 [Alphaproteobacteria bacterium]|nr:hypothetical protein [Alphaproteobacteria bacterium]